MAKVSDMKDRKYSNSDIAVMAVYKWSGALRYVHLEDIAISAAELSPRRFSWKKYPDQINLEAVRLALKNELSAPEGRVTGGIRDGWMLTPIGLTWCLRNAEVGDAQALLDSIHKEADRAKKTAAFTKTIENREKEVSKTEVEAILRINEYSAARNRRERATALANAAMLDSELKYVLITLKRLGFDQLEVMK